MPMRIRTGITYVCHVVKCKSHMLIDDDKQNMDELEGCVTAMAWDWDTEDIDADEDDGKLSTPYDTTEANAGPCSMTEAQWTSLSR